MKKRSQQLAMDAFVLRQFDASKTSNVINFGVKAFEQKVLEHYTGPSMLVDGYAPFCKHVFMPNFVPDLFPTSLPITEQNHALLETKYDARTDKELAVLVRYFPKQAVQQELKQAAFLDVILYSREQINKESKAMGLPLDTDNADVPWAIISIKAQDVAFEQPMQPITMMRNALISEGGSGVDIDREQYNASVAFWREHAVIA
jgi:hypothetical protein